MPAGTPVELGHVNDSAADPTVITVGSAVPAGDLVIVTAGNVGVTYSNVTDSRGNTYTRTINNAGGGFDGLLIAWSRITVALQVNDTISVSDGFGGVHECVQAIWVPTISPSPLDQSSVNATSGTSWTSNSTPTTGQGDDFLFGAISVNGSAGTPNQPGGWTGSPTTPTFTVAGQVNGRRDYQNVSSTGAYAYNAGFSSGTNFYAAGIIAFKAAQPAGVPQSARYKFPHPPIGGPA